MKLSRLKFTLGLDWSLFLLPLLLTGLGTAVIFSISYGTNSTLALNQIEFFLIGIAATVFLTYLDYRTLKGLSLVLYIIGVILLIAVLLIGSKSFGATRWIDLKFFQLQPSELFKIIILIVLAKFFSDWQELDLRKIIFILALVGVPTLLILRQPDLGTASVIFIGLLTVLFLSPIKKIYLIVALAIAVVISPLGWHYLKPYQQLRITSFINPSADPHGTGYNVSQAKIAVGSGGLWGTGLGKGSQSQLNFLPVSHTDFIFAGTAEATGFIGSTFLIILLILLVMRTINVAVIAKDNFGMYLSGGIAGIFLFQILVNIGMNLGIMPVTGIPLPFVSSGGSSMITNMAAIGILQSIYLRHRKITF
ncbi:TPA: rod shape-determining protein RodA [Candidatus Berkelbacteria bacterium]|uniref:Peptidoglycan glycosyltransferase RodA n=1 Tax=Berkelbacteria bacterium GW2011_GWE1_39_12 TaxID=1618337 RepID=A0A0G4B220_9BACT|nr:MAG: rod shape-determining protein RodA, rod shape determining protein RodA [Berkelbacteria bacterium GW2011_GWE1_39_12]HBO60456.1 rod shape-determining protein RodA [Candidatus Berkelbacteria bacterium]